MEKSEILDRVRNRLTLPMTLLEMFVHFSPTCQLAIQEIKELIIEIENPPESGEGSGGTKNETTHQ